MGGEGWKAKKGLKIAFTFNKNRLIKNGQKQNKTGKEQPDKTRTVLKNDKNCF